MPEMDEGQIYMCIYISYYESQHHRHPCKGRTPSGFSGPSRDSEGTTIETRGRVWALGGWPLGFSVRFLRVTPVVCVAVAFVCFRRLRYPVRLKRWGRGRIAQGGRAPNSKGQVSPLAWAAGAALSGATADL